MFVRVKIIRGRKYGYLVENTWVKGAARQRTKAYLGAIIAQQDRPPPELAADTPATRIIPALIDAELQGLSDVKVSWSRARVRRGKRDVVVQLNGGYLCGHTLRQLRRACVSPDRDDRPGLALAQALAACGLRMPQQWFIRLYMECTR